MTLSRYEKAPVRLVVEFHLIPVANLVEALSELIELAVGHLEAREHAAEVGAVVAIMKQADVPAPAQCLEKLQERAGPLGEFKSAQPLVDHFLGAAANHVPYVQFRQLVVAEIDGLKPAVAERRGNLFCVTARANGDADEDVRTLASAEAIVELGDDARPERRAEREKCTALLGNGDREDGLARFTHFGTFRDKTQAIEVHVRAAQDRDDRC